MSYEPLHHKYRPQTFANLVGQEAIATTLINAIRTERIAPAYLFTGPRGTGKTSSARILAKSLNCKKQDQPTELPCGVCEVCTSIASGSALDVIEIDAASNTGVDNIREIIERAQFAPVQCRYKVYVIDEVHMLSSAAFNALLKTLEEPPARVVFVLATTDPQRVLPTIISRCQRFDFRRIPLEAMVSHLTHIASQEKINIAPDAVTLVAQVAQGGLRDAESLLDQLSLLPDQVTVEAVWDLVGAVPERDLMELTQAIASDNSEAVLEQCRRLMDRGREPLVVLQNLAGFYRDLLIAKTAPTRSDLVAVTPPTWKQLREFAQQLESSDILIGSQHLKNSEAQIKNTTQPRLWLEVTLLGLLPSANKPTLVNSTQLPYQKAAAPVTRQTGEQNRQQPSTSVASPSTTAVSQTLSQVPPTQAPKASPPTSVHSENLETPPSVSHSVDSVNAAERDRSPSSSASDRTPVESNRNSQTHPDSPAGASELAGQNPVDDQPAELEQVWQKVLNQIKLFSTKELLRQHCYLLTFKGQEASIGISSKNLLKLAQTKLPEVEAAFQAVYKFKVRVNLQPVNSTALTSTPANAQPYGHGNSVSFSGATPEQLAEPSSGEPDRTKAEPEGRAAFQNRLSETQNTPKDANATRTVIEPVRQVFFDVEPQTQIETISDHPSTLLTQSPLSPPAQGLDWDAEEVEKALGSLKQFFEGEIIELTDESSKVESVIPHQLQSEAVTHDPSDQLEPDKEAPGGIEPADTELLGSADLATLPDAQAEIQRGDWKLDDDGDIEF